MERGLYSISESAARLGVSEALLKDAIAAGSLKFITINGIKHIPGEILEAFKVETFLKGADLLSRSSRKKANVEQVMEMQETISKDSLIQSTDSSSEIIENLQERNKKIRYSRLIFELIGVRMTESKSEILWTAISQHQSDLKKLLNRTVTMQVALLDYLSIHPNEEIDIRLITRSAYQSLTKNSLRDPLTGLYSRSVFEEYLHKEWHHSERQGTILSLVICDIDHFKHFNDIHGHQLGDEVLRLTARILNRACRRYDICARFGGEEFVTLMPHSTISEAAQYCERTRKRIRELNAQLEIPEIITLSYGISSSRHTTTPDLLFQHADIQLYRAKRAGRDRTAADGAGITTHSEPVPG